MMESSLVFLGIEGGGTRTIALIADQNLKAIGQREFAPGNVRLLTDAELEARFGQIAAFCPSPSAIGLGMAGARESQDRERILRAAERVWPKVPAFATHDLEIALLAADEVPGTAASVLVLSGTGSCCYGQCSRGVEAKLGGWGHLLGDKGSGFELGLAAARAVVYDYDRYDRWTPLGEEILRSLLLNKPDDLIGWIAGASKAEIAALAVPVFHAAARRDKLAQRILNDAARTLASDAVLCARRLVTSRQKVGFVLAGSVLQKQKEFARQVAGMIKAALPLATITQLQREGAWGAIKLAAKAGTASISSSPAKPAATIYVPEFVPGESPTEQRNPRSIHFDKLTISESISLMLNEEESIAAALRLESKAIAAAIRICSEALKAGGRIFYAGAGTSGRLGVLDASECPPTFRTSPDMVQGIMAGGQRALWQAVEGAEDDPSAGAASARFRGIRRGDVLIGIAASGRTPFVWGALAAARQAKARTVLLQFNPALKIKAKERPDIIIAPHLGPEVLTGSTRLKCGTATKLVLNMITTISMVRLGKVVSNLMVDLNPSNIKLRDRAVRIVREITGCDADAAQNALVQHGWVIKKALTALRG